MKKKGEFIEFLLNFNSIFLKNIRTACTNAYCALAVQLLAHHTGGILISIWDQPYYFKLTGINFYFYDFSKV